MLLPTNGRGERLPNKEVKRKGQTNATPAGPGVGGGGQQTAPGQHDNEGDVTDEIATGETLLVLVAVPLGAGCLLIVHVLVGIVGGGATNDKQRDREEEKKTSCYQHDHRRDTVYRTGGKHDDSHN